jgi:lipoate-protein ligase B
VDPAAQPLCQVVELGRVDYREAFELQQQLALRRLVDEIPDTLLLLEHPPVLTLGRRGTWQHILVDSERLVALGIDVQPSTRGGLVTYHGPGQLVAYAVCRLREIAPGGVPQYVYGLEESVIGALANLGVQAWRLASHPGVWTEQGKVGAVGVALHRGVTLHGVAVNLQPDLAHFALINPCGLGELGVSSVLRLTGREVDLLAFGRLLAERFGTVFGRRMVLPQERAVRYNSL